MLLYVDCLYVNVVYNNLDDNFHEQFQDLDLDKIRLK